MEEQDFVYVVQAPKTSRVLGVAKTFAGGLEILKKEYPNEGIRPSGGSGVWVDFGYPRGLETARVAKLEVHP